jgi:hypothetical protein
MGLLTKLTSLWGPRSRASGPAHAAPSNTTPERAFVELCIAEAHQHPRVERVEAGEGSDLPVSIWLADTSEPTKMFLKNTFLETRDLPPDGKRAALQRLLGIVDAVDEELDWDEARQAVVPLVRTTGFGTLGPQVSRPLVPFLRVFLGIDRDTSISYVTRGQLDEWQQPESAVFAQAFAVLQAHIDDPDPEPPEVEPYDTGVPYGIWQVTRNDSYETSRLALPGFLASFRGKVLGTPIAVVPHRGLMVISGDGEPAAIARLCQMAENEFNAAPRPISPALYTIDGRDEVVPLQLPGEHPQRLAVERGHRLLAATCYADQKAELEQAFETEQRDVFVASVMLFSEKQTGELRSWAAMTEGVDTLLPEVDVVALMRQADEQPLMVPWAKALELAPRCFMREAGCDPPRYRCVAFPNAAELEELGRHRLA